MEEMETVRQLSHLEILIAASLFLAGLFIHPLSSLKERSDTFDSLTLRVVLIPAAVFISLLLHEFTHVIFMRLFGAEKILIRKAPGVTAAGSDAYYDRFSFTVISLAPVILMGILLSVVSFLVPVRWFWVVFPMLIISFSGSSSDYYAAWIALGSAAGSLIRDTGLELTVYSPNNNNNIQEV